MGKRVPIVWIYWGLHAHGVVAWSVNLYLEVTRNFSQASTRFWLVLFTSGCPSFRGKHRPKTNQNKGGRSVEPGWMVSGKQGFEHVAPKIQLFEATWKKKLTFYFWSSVWPSFWSRFWSNWITETTAGTETIKGRARPCCCIECCCFCCSFWPKSAPQKWPNTWPKNWLFPAGCFKQQYF